MGNAKGLEAAVWEPGQSQTSLSGFAAHPSCTPTPPTRGIPALPAPLIPPVFTAELRGVFLHRPDPADHTPFLHSWVLALHPPLQPCSSAWFFDFFFSSAVSVSLISDTKMSAKAESSPSYGLSLIGLSPLSSHGHSPQQVRSHVSVSSLAFSSEPILPLPLCAERVSWHGQLQPETQHVSDPTTHLLLQLVHFRRCHSLGH